MRRSVLLAAFGYVGASLAFWWPLPLHLSTHLTGPPSGDTGVYVWNLWVFRHELVVHHRFPLYSTAIFSLDPPADLSLHNFTPFQNLLALPVLQVLGVVASFNLVNIAMTVLAAFSAFLLARRISGSAVAAWLAGAFFAFCPFMVARSTAHFSLLGAAPLPVFMWLLLAAEERPRPWLGVGLGATAAWAFLCDAYYGVFCGLLLAYHLAARTLRVSRAEGPAPRWVFRAARALEVLIAAASAVVVYIAVTGGATIELLGLEVGMTSLHNPVAALVGLVICRVVVAVRPRLTLHVAPAVRDVARLWPYAVVTAVLALMPHLIAIARRLATGRFASPPTYWRSSPPGVDLVSYLIPNPQHPLLGAPWQGWLAALPGGYAENVASLSFVVLAVAGVALWRVTGRARDDARYWVGLSLFFLLLSLGPFLQVGGVNTYVPTPWAFLRYVPVVGLARSPGRIAILVAMGAAVLFALGLRRLAGSTPSRRIFAMAAIAAVLAFEITPIPRRLFAAGIPSFYDQIAADPRHVRVLELPFGVRSGAANEGDFSARSQFHQTRHEKRLIGGYLSRVSNRRFQTVRARPTLAALLDLSAGRTLTPAERERVRLPARAFLRRAHVGYVVIDRARATPALVDFALEMFDLERIAVSGEHELYRPRAETRAAR